MKTIYICYTETNKATEAVIWAECAHSTEEAARNWVKASPLEKRFYQSLILHEG